MPLETGSRIGSYEIVAPLGAGGMGEVYRARDSKLNREVAIKVLPAALADDPQYMARFEREAQTLAALNHPNIATVFGIEQGALVMELVEGPTLADRIARGPLPHDEALPIARQIADGLGAAHERGIVHRDLKPANIKITPAGAVKLLDFGLAKTGGELAAGAGNSISPTLSLAMTQAGYILGTAGYMSPEQARGHAVDRRTDIWAFGVVVWEMLTGRRMFDGGTVSDTMAAVLRADIDLTLLPEDTPGPVRRMLRRCLQRESNRRLSDIADARLELDEPSEIAAPSSAPAKSTIWIPWAVSAALVLALVAALWFRPAWLRGEPARPMVKFDVHPPEGITFGHVPAPSPDGRRIAEVAHVKATHVIALRALDGLTTEILNGSDDGREPFWSPDGQALAFFTRTPRKLKRMVIGGGPPVTVCDVPEGMAGQEGSWNRHGLILFGDADGGLYRVSAGGGIPVKAPASPGLARSSPRFLPDDKHYLFRGVTKGASGVWVGSIDSASARRLTDADSFGLFAPAAPGAARGYLLFAREQTLMAQPFDASRLELSGEPFPLAERISGGGGTLFFGAAGTGVLVYQVGRDVSTDLILFDRAGRFETPFASGTYSEVAVSRDGRAALAEGNVAALTGRELWLLDLERKIHTRFTFNPKADTHPVWSPDGERIAYASQRDGALDLYVKASSGGGAEQLLLQSPARKLPTDWTRDGRFLIYTEGEATAASDIWMLPMTGERKPLPYLKTEFSEAHGTVSPDGAYLAYQSNESGAWEVYVRTFPDASRGKWQISSGGGTQPHWKHDGTELFYVAPNVSRQIVAAPVKLGSASAPSLTVSAPTGLFDSMMIGNVGGVSAKYGLLPGDRFLVAGYSERETAPLTVVLNWK